MQASVGIVVCLAWAGRSCAAAGRFELEPVDVAGALVDIGEGSSVDSLRADLATVDLAKLRTRGIPDWLRASLIHAAARAQRSGRRYYDLDDLCDALVMLQSKDLEDDLTTALNAIRVSIPDIELPDSYPPTVIAMGAAVFGSARAASREPDEGP